MKLYVVSTLQTKESLKAYTKLKQIFNYHEIMCSIDTANQRKPQSIHIVETNI